MKKYIKKIQKTNTKKEKIYNKKKTKENTKRN